MHMEILHVHQIRHVRMDDMYDTYMRHILQRFTLRLFRKNAFHQVRYFYDSSIGGQFASLLGGSLPYSTTILYELVVLYDTLSFPYSFCNHSVIYVMAVLCILVTTVLYRGSYSSVRGQKTISYAAPKPIIKIARTINWIRKHLIARGKSTSEVCPE